MALCTLALVSGWLSPAAAEPEAERPALLPDADHLRLASVNALVADLDSGAMLYSKNADRSVPIASVTKLMAAMVILDSGQRLDEWIPVVERDRPAPVNAYSHLRIGSELRRRDLLQLTLVASENLAAHVLARHYPGGKDAFVEAMNAKALALGMNDTRFVDPAGLSHKNRSTPNDLLRMVEAAMGYVHIREFSTRRQYTARFRYPRYELRYGNTNRLVRNPRWNVLVSKTGYLDAAGRCLVMVTDVDGRQIAMVLIDSFGRNSHIGDAGRVRRWIETGEGGAVADAALIYERERNAAYASGTVATPEHSGSQEVGGDAAGEQEVSSP